MCSNTQTMPITAISSKNTVEMYMSHCNPLMPNSITALPEAVSSRTKPVLSPLILLSSFSHAFAHSLSHTTHRPVDFVDSHLAICVRTNSLLPTSASNISLHRALDLTIIAASTSPPPVSPPPTPRLSGLGLWPLVFWSLLPALWSPASALWSLDTSTYRPRQLGFPASVPRLLGLCRLLNFPASTCQDVSAHLERFLLPSQITHHH